MKASEYSQGQRDLIGQALRIARHDLSGTSGVKTPWKRVVGEIGAYTDLRVPDSEKDLRLMAERFRQFVEDARKIDSQEIQYITDYLVHPEIRRLHVEELLSPDLSIHSGVHLYNFLHEGYPPDDGLPCNTLSEWFSDAAGSSEREQISYVKLTESHALGVFDVFHVQVKQDTSNCQKSANGWAIVLPDRELFIALKDTRSAKNRLFFDNSRVGSTKENDQLLLMELSLDASELFTDDLLVQRNPKRNTSNKRVVKIVQFQSINSSHFEKSRHRDNIVMFGKPKPRVKSASGFAVVEKKHKPIGIHREWGDLNKRNVDELGKELFDLIGSFEVEDTSDRISELFLKGAPIDYRCPDTGSSYLHAIAASNDRNALRVLLKQENVDFLSRNRLEQLPSFIAIRSRANEDLIEFLIAQEQDQGKRDNQIVNPLHTTDATP